MSALERLGLQQQSDDGPATSSPTQDQTGRAFGFKWAQRSSYEAEPMRVFTRTWLLDKYCDGDPTVIDGWLAGGRKLILDAGCGAGYSALLLFGDHLRDHDYLGIDISDSVAVARQRFREHDMPGDFLKADLMELPIPDASVDLIFSEGVLHHTDDTCAAMATLARKLRPGGRFCFYVYARKGPIREFTDDLVREHIAPMDDDAAWEALRPLTRLGIALGELDVQVDVPEDIPWLGIGAGRVDVQRFFYYIVMKSFYRPELSFDELHHVNFDWFRPANCHRHTEAEVRACCDHAGLEIQRLHAEPSGFTVVAARR